MSIVYFNDYPIVIRSKIIIHLIRTGYSTRPLIKRHRLDGLLERGSSRDNLDELASDDGLSGPVEREGQLLDHLSGVLGGVVHGGHAGALLGAGAFLHGVEYHGGERELHVGLQDLGVEGVVCGQLRGVLRSNDGD